MKLDWMREYREVVEQLIKYCNKYAAIYKKELLLGTDIPVSYAQIQVIEYLLENEELHQNMKQIAQRLGITTSNFSKLVNKLEEKKLLQKFHTTNNQKEIIVQVTSFGKAVYQEYANFIMDTHFSKMFNAGKEIPKEVLPLIAEMIGAPLIEQNDQIKDAPSLIPVQKQ